jgi:nitroreductase
MDYPGAVPFPGDPQVRKISPDLVRYLLASRRTIRQFKNTPISHDVLVELLDNARYAPSGFNLHPVQWMIAEDRGVIERLSSLTVEWLKSLDSGAVPDEYAPLLPVIPKIIDNWESGRDPICYHAPALVIAHADQKISSAGYDALIALSYLDLIAPVFQLGTCWAGLLQMAISTSPRISAVLPLPQGHITHHILLIGKPRYDVYQIPKRAPPVISFV